MTAPELLSALAARGLIADPQLSLPPDPESNPSPWFMQVVMGFCAWFAGMLLFAFLIVGLERVIFDGHEHWGTVFVIGLCSCALAGYLYAVVGARSSFVAQFALAVSIGGQTAIVLAIGGSFNNARPALWGMLLLEVLLTFVMRNGTHRVFTTFAAVTAWALATHEVLFGRLPGLDWNANEAAQTSLAPFLLWFVVWGPVAYAAYRLVAGEAKWMAEGRDPLLRPVMHGLIAALAIAPLGTHPGTFWLAMGFGPSRDFYDNAPGLTAFWPLLSMLLALLALALAFALRHRPLMGVAMVFALLDVSAFYYVLGTTLLIKSIVMLAMGVALLLSAQWLAKEAK